MNQALIQLQPHKLIRLGGKLYDIRYTPEDEERREKGMYSDQEEKLLHDIGLTDMDKQLSENDKKQLPGFFQALPSCQTSAAISLSAKCYQPHYIIESIQRHADLEKQDQFEKMKQMPSPTLDTLYRSMIPLNGIANLITGSALVKGISRAGETVTDTDIYDFFMLRIPV